MPFGGLTHMGPRNHVLDGVPDPKLGRGVRSFVIAGRGPAYSAKERSGIGWSMRVFA